MGSKKYSHTEAQCYYTLLGKFKKSKERVNDSINLKKRNKFKAYLS